MKLLLNFRSAELSKFTNSPDDVTSAPSYIEIVSNTQCLNQQIEQTKTQITGKLQVKN